MVQIEMKTFTYLTYLRSEYLLLRLEKLKGSIITKIKPRDLCADSAKIIVYYYQIMLIIMLNFGLNGKILNPGTANNAGAILVIGRGLMIVPKLIHPLPPPLQSPEMSPDRLQDDTWMQVSNLFHDFLFECIKARLLK